MEKAEKEIDQIGHEVNVIELLMQIQGLKSIIAKLKDYFESKNDANSTKALFPCFEEPSFWQVGALIELNGGHTREFSWKEELRLNTHLMKANFGDSETSNYLHDIALDSSKLKI